MSNQRGLVSDAARTALRVVAGVMFTLVGAVVAGFVVWKISGGVPGGPGVSVLPFLLAIATGIGWIIFWSVYFAIRMDD